ncbi:MAG: hypothetical protein FWD65_03505 [Coriobacteriia bacterium]|nr:hypothetical protein [Coriobacteriia bacterium]
MRCAAIDIGTVTTRLLIAEVTDDRVREIARRIEITHLGAGLGETGQLDDGGIERVAAACAQFRALMDSEQVEAYRCVATSAAREADNTAELAAKLARSGLRLEVISGEEEARLSFAGATYGRSGQGLLVVDPGGGSTEFVLGDVATLPPRVSPAPPRACPPSSCASPPSSCAQSQDPARRGSIGFVPGDVASAPPLSLRGARGATRQSSISFARSLQLGSQRMTDGFLSNDPPMRVELAYCRAVVHDLLARRISELRGQVREMIAVAGTATTMVTARDGIEPYDAARVQGARVTSADLRVLMKRFCAVPTDERAQIPGLEPQRASVIIAGTLILQEILDYLGLEQFSVSDTDLLYGILLMVSAQAGV